MSHQAHEFLESILNRREPMESLAGGCAKQPPAFMRHRPITNIFPPLYTTFKHLSPFFSTR